MRYTMLNTDKAMINLWATSDAKAFINAKDKAYSAIDNLFCQYMPKGYTFSNDIDSYHVYSTKWHDELYTWITDNYEVNDYKNYLQSNVLIDKLKGILLDIVAKVAEAEAEVAKAEAKAIEVSDTAWAEANNSFKDNYSNDSRIKYMNALYDMHSAQRLKINANILLKKAFVEKAFVEAELAKAELYNCISRY